MCRCRGVSSLKCWLNVYYTFSWDRFQISSFVTNFLDPLVMLHKPHFENHSCREHDNISAKYIKLLKSKFYTPHKIILIKIFSLTLTHDERNPDYIFCTFILIGASKERLYAFNDLSDSVGGVILLINSGLLWYFWTNILALQMKNGLHGLLEWQLKRKVALACIL